MSFFTQLSPDFAVAAQLSAADMNAVKQAGFKSVIINRPDAEGGGEQPLSSDVIEAAQALGLQIVYQPVQSGQIGPDDVDLFAQHIDQLPKPILAYCRTGRRCTVLYQSI